MGFLDLVEAEMTGHECCPQFVRDLAAFANAHPFWIFLICWLIAVGWFKGLLYTAPRASR